MAASGPAVRGGGVVDGARGTTSQLGFTATSSGGSFLCVMAGRSGGFPFGPWQSIQQMHVQGQVTPGSLRGHRRRRHVPRHRDHPRHRPDPRSRCKSQNNRRLLRSDACAHETAAFTLSVRRLPKHVRCQASLHPAGLSVNTARYSTFRRQRLDLTARLSSTTAPRAGRVTRRIWFAVSSTAGSTETPARLR